jgi:hypothetical protein
MCINIQRNIALVVVVVVAVVVVVGLAYPGSLISVRVQAIDVY